MAKMLLALAAVETRARSWDTRHNTPPDRGSACAAHQHPSDLPSRIAQKDAGLYGCVTCPGKVLVHFGSSHVGQAHERRAGVRRMLRSRDKAMRDEVSK